MKKTLPEAQKVFLWYYVDTYKKRSTMLHTFPLKIMSREMENFYDVQMDEWMKNPAKHQKDIEGALNHIDREADFPGSEIDRQNDTGCQLRQLLRTMPK